MHFKSLVSSGPGGGLFNLWHTQTLEKRRKASWWFIPLLLLNRALIYRDLRKSLSLLGGLSPWEAWHSAEGMGCFHKDAEDAPQVAAVLSGILLMKTKKPHKTSLQTFPWPLFSRAQAVVWLMPTSTPRQASFPYFQDTIFITTSLCHHTVMEQSIYWFLVWFLDFSLKAGETWARTVLAWEQGSRNRHCSGHSPSAHTSSLYPLPLTQNFSTSLILWPVTNLNSCKSSVLCVPLQLKGLKRNSEHLLQCTISPTVFPTPFPL